MRMSTLGKALVEQTCVLLLLGDGMTPKAVIDQVQVTRPKIFKWRKRYLEAGIEGLENLPRSGQPLKLVAGKNQRNSQADDQERP